MTPTAGNEERLTRRAAAIIDRLAARQAHVITSVQRLLADDITELRGDPHLLELLRASVAGNIETVFDALRYDIPLQRIEPPTAAMEYARRLAQHGIPANALVRAYRLGQQALLGEVVTAIRSSGIDASIELDVFNKIATLTFRYIDWITEQVVATYEEERDRWLDSRNSVRAVRVRELLDATDLDIDAVTIEIRYPLRRTHVALMLWYPDPDVSGHDVAGLERFASELADAVTCRDHPLFVAVDRATAWAWLPLTGKSPTRVVERLRRSSARHDDPPRIAVGAPLPDVNGFRRSHHQAVLAHTVAAAAGADAAQPVTAATDPGLAPAALLAADLDQATAWIRETLGELASDTKNDARLRETLRVYLSHNGGYKAAAAELDLHYNSVRYRVARALERRGKPLADDRLDVELALLTCRHLGTAALRTGQP